MKTLFLDTEFTAFDRPELISLALVPEDDAVKPFYLENRWISRKKASKFTIERVIPLLTGPRAHEPDFTVRLCEYLSEIGNCRIIATLCMDFELLYRALGGFHGPPSSATYPSITCEIVSAQAEEYHHALQDALALRKWYARMAA